MVGLIPIGISLVRRLGPYEWRLVPHGLDSPVKKSDGTQQLCQVKEGLGPPDRLTVVLGQRIPAFQVLHELAKADGVCLFGDGHDLLLDRAQLAGSR